MSHDAFWALVNVGVTIVCLLGIGIASWYAGRKF